MSSTAKTTLKCPHAGSVSGTDAIIIRSFSRNIDHAARTHFRRQGYLEHVAQLPVDQQGPEIASQVHFRSRAISDWAVMSRGLIVPVCGTRMSNGPSFWPRRVSQVSIAACASRGMNGPLPVARDEDPDGTRHGIENTEAHSDRIRALETAAEYQPEGCGV